MKPYYQDGSVTLYHGDCREILNIGCRAFIFWLPPPEPFPLAFSALHVWSKGNVYRGALECWEAIYEVNGQRIGSVLREATINCEMNATLNRDVYYGHPCQKPIKLMRRLLQRTEGIVCDPFFGTGPTLLAAKELGRRAIGIEIEERYCEIAAKRLAQEVLNL